MLNLEFCVVIVLLPEVFPHLIIDILMIIYAVCQLVIFMPKINKGSLV